MVTKDHGNETLRSDDERLSVSIESSSVSQDIN